MNLCLRLSKTKKKYIMDIFFSFDTVVGELYILYVDKNVKRQIKKFADHDMFYVMSCFLTSLVHNFVFF
jgi:hypothetical protein